MDHLTGSCISKSSSAKAISSSENSSNPGSLVADYMNNNFIKVNHTHLLSLSVVYHRHINQRNVQGSGRGKMVQIMC